MTEQNFIDTVKKCEIPFRYLLWKNEQPTPFGVFSFPNSTNFFADGKVFVGKTEVRFELYTDEKSRSAENSVEKMLDELGLAWEKSETYIESERLFEVDYSCEVIFDE